MKLERTLLGAALACAFALSTGANAQNVSEGEIDQTTGQTGATQQGGQANVNELKDSTGAQPGDAAAADQQSGQGGQAATQRPQQSGQGGQPSAQPQQGAQSGQSPDSSAQGQAETTGQGQGVKDSGGEAAAGTHQGQGGDPGRGATGHTGTDSGVSKEVDPKQAQ